LCDDLAVRNKGGSKRLTFAEIVAAVEATPPPIPEPRDVRPGRYSGDTLYDLDGNPLGETDARALEPEEVRAAVLAGAQLVWDACGCGGYCNDLEWPDLVALRREAKRSAPQYHKRDPVRVERLTGAGGEVLLATGGLRWGDLVR
jgi:hypothetical protein